MLPQKLSSEAPAPVRQDSQSPEQSAARREALAHLFDDFANNEHQDQPVTTVEPAAALPLFNLSHPEPLQHQQAPIRADQRAPAEELPVSPKPVSRKKARARQRAAVSPTVQVFEHGTFDDEMASTNNFVPTNQHRQLRACMVCSVVKTESQFKKQGCPNCEAFLQLRGDDDQISACTSQVFEGLMTVSDTSRSWVARWQRLEGYVPGVYAVQVEGLLPEDVISAAEDAGIHYIPRDGSVNEALPTDT